MQECVKFLFRNPVLFCFLSALFDGESLFCNHVCNCGQGIQIGYPALSRCCYFFPPVKSSSYMFPLILTLALAFVLIGPLASQLRLSSRFHV